MDRNPQEIPARRCAKCGTAMPAPDWVVNKDMAYCGDCAALLHLGESKESKTFNEPPGKAAGRAPEELAVPIPDDPDI